MSTCYFDLCMQVQNRSCSTECFTILPPGLHKAAWRQSTEFETLLDAKVIPVPLLSTQICCMPSKVHCTDKVMSNVSHWLCLVGFLGHPYVKFRSLTV